MINVKRTQQNSEGDNSPNFDIDIDKAYFNLSENQGNEVLVIMKLIGVISQEAQATDSCDSDKDLSSKDAQFKIYVRFKKWSQELVAEYQELALCYGESYKIATNESPIDDFIAMIIPVYLKGLSNEALEKNDDNPILALGELTRYFEKELKKTIASNFSYNTGAIRFYLFKQLIECNIFPNPQKYANAEQQSLNIT